MPLICNRPDKPPPKTLTSNAKSVAQLEQMKVGMPYLVQIMENKKHSGTGIGSAGFKEGKRRRIVTNALTTIEGSKSASLKQSKTVSQLGSMNNSATRKF